MNRSRQKGKKSYVTQVVERGGKQNAGLKIKTNGTVAECRVKRYITARQKGEDDLCHTGLRCNVLYVKVSTGSRAKGMVLERHM
jgi:hypothetical protein